MASLMKVRWLPCLVITSLILIGRIGGSRNGELASYFRDDFRGESLSQMVVSNASGIEFVYVGGDSTIYRLNTDLNQLREEATCLDPGCDAKILEVAPSPVNKLIYCGSSDGKCGFRDLTSLLSDNVDYMHTFVQEGMSVGVVTEKSARELIMFVAQSHSAATDRLYPISQTELQGPKTLVLSQSIRQVDGDATVEYIQGVSWKNYSYFIVHSGSENTRLGRICAQNEQGDLDAYSEIILSCQDTSYDSLEAVDIDLINDTLYGVFTNGTSSVLCSYAMIDIQEKFIDATCGCARSESDDAGCDGKRISYLSNSECFSRVNDRNGVKDSQCVSLGDQGQKLYQYAEARSALNGTVLDFNLPGQHSSLVIFNKEIITVALVITSSSPSSATLNKIHIQSDNSGRRYEMVELDTNGDLLKDAYINNESEELYILTTGEVMKLAVVNCSQYETCGECLGPSNDEGDPFCGWCIFETKCSRASECGDATNRLQYNEDCIAINNLSSEYQEIGDNPQMVSFDVSQLPIPVSDSEYTCRFDGIETDTDVNGMSINCSTPAVGDRPEIQNGENSVTMVLGVYSNSQDVIIVTADYDFFSCSAIKSCSECTSSKWGCDWCVYAGRCTLNGVSSCTADGENVVENGEEGSCPRLDDVSKEILIPVGLRRVIHLTGTNLPSTTNPTQVDYKCVLSRDGIPFKTVSVSNVNSTFVECEETEYDYNSTDGLEIQVSISVEYLSSGVFIDNRDNTVTLYNCAVNGMSCRSCVTLEIRDVLECGWCEGTSTCQVNVDDRQCGSNFLRRGDSTSCPNAAITKIFPVSGPIEGNTTLTISGTNLAAQFDEISNITVATVECIATNLTFNPGTSIDCVTGSSHNETLEGPVTVVFSFGSDTSGESFSYKNPSVSEFSPVTGIAAGGTELEISGNDLNTGKRYQGFCWEC
ncbi:plexin-A4-like [Lytechinus variegatus]|uniref:plexin-A4-like n=1 Tax=Lytechinus variegatus TaxID=7654 RepID=UPI001BB0E053|nr:plexin-A4-like [Lytechinus variegatus]